MASLMYTHSTGFALRPTQLNFEISWIHFRWICLFRPIFRVPSVWFGSCWSRNDIENSSKHILDTDLWLFGGYRKLRKPICCSIELLSFLSTTLLHQGAHLKHENLILKCFNILNIDSTVLFKVSNTNHVGFWIIWPPFSRLNFESKFESGVW